MLLMENVKRTSQLAITIPYSQCPRGREAIEG